MIISALLGGLVDCKLIAIDQEHVDSYLDMKFVSNTFSFFHMSSQVCAYLVYLARLATARAMLASQDNLLNALLSAARAADAISLDTLSVSDVRIQLADS